MATLHIERGVQFRSELYKAPDRAGWFKAMGDELAARKLSITVAPGLVIKNGDDAVAFFKRYQSDKAGLQAQLALPAGVRVENYVADLIQALDDCVKPTSDVVDKVLDFGATSEMSKVLGLDTSSTYASKKTGFGAAAPDKVFSVLGIQMSRNAAPVDPLKDKVFMDATTFGGMASYSWARDDVELEQVFGVSGMDSKQLLETLRTTNAAGRTTFQRLRKPEACEAYTMGYSGMGLDDMKWDSDSHKMREANKFVALTIESGRFDPDPTTGERGISLGTDKMDDVYYDTAKFDLLKNDYSVRGRARWDTDKEIRRILVAVKSNTEMDEFGLKRCGKVDVRNDGASPEEIANLDRDVRRGKTSWNGSDSAVKPLKGLYDGLNAKGLLPNVGDHKGVLLMEPKLHVRSVRSRYHLNETDLGAIQKHYTACTQDRLKSVLGLVGNVKASLTGNDLASVTALETKTNALLDNSAVAAAAADRLKALDPAMTVTADSIKDLLPNVTRSSWGGGVTNDALSIQKKRVVADALDEVFHAYSKDLDGARRVLTQAQDRTLEEQPAMFADWARSKDKALLNKRTMDPFLPVMDAMLAKPAADLAADITAYNTFGAEQKAAGNKKFKDFVPVTVDTVKGLRAQLVNEEVRVWQRQLESGGSTALSLWFDEARAFFVPEARRNTGNFIIDTTDMSEFVKHADWEAIPADQRTPANQIPKEKVFHTTLVNETQIELGEEKAYLARMSSLGAAIHKDQASLLLKHFAANNSPGFNAADPATGAAALANLLGLPQAARDAEIARFNQFLTAQGSALRPVTAADLGHVDAALFTAETRDLPVRTKGDVEANLDGARFIFEQLTAIQQQIVKSKGDRILKTLKDAGAPASLAWKQTDASKGDLGMEILAGTR